MGIVYRAQQRSLRRTVALKLLLMGRFSSPEHIERFLREAESAAQLRHPNIVSIHEFGTHEGQHYFSMDLIEGQSLAEILREGPLAGRKAAEYCRVIAEAVHYAHEQGVIHRDLKPSNILIDLMDQPRITDFGLAKKMDGRGDLTASGEVLGSPNYLSPEQAAGRHREVGPRSDVYSLGAMLYELLTGRPPFLAESLPETLVRIRDAEPLPPRLLNRSVTRDLETICLKCLEKNSARRYDTASELAQDLKRFLRGEPVRARPIGAAGRLERWARRQPKLAAMVLVTVLAGLALILTLTVANVRIRTAHQQTEVKAQESRQELVRLSVFSGNKLVEEGDCHGALLWFVEALRLEEGNVTREDVHRRRLASMLQGSPRLAQLWFHDGFVNNADFSPDGTRVVSGSLDHTARVHDTFTGQPIAPPFRHKGDVMGARFTPDGRNIVTVDDYGKLRFWDPGTGQTLGTPLLTAASEAEGLDFSTDGRWLAAPVSGGIQFLEVMTGELAHRMFPCTDAVQVVRFSPNGLHLGAFGLSSPALWLWDLSQVSSGRKPFRHASPIRRFAFSHDGRRVATITLRELTIWDVSSGELVCPPIQPGGDLFDCRFSPDDRWLATASWRGSARVFDVESGQLIGESMRHRAAVGQSVFSLDGRMLATASWDGTGRLWNPRTGEPVSPFLRHAGFVLSANFSPDSSRLLTTGQDQTVRLWELRTNGPARLTLNHQKLVTQASFSPEGGRILTCGHNGAAKAWDLRTGQLLATLQHPSALVAARFSPNGKKIVTANADGTARLWDASSGEEIIRPMRHAKLVRHAEFSPDGERIVTASDDATARVWKANGTPATPPLQHRKPVAHAAFSPVGQRVITASHDHTAQIWNAETGERIGPPLKHICAVNFAGFSPDGSRVVTACGDRTLLGRAAQVWDATTGLPLGPPLRHRDGVLHAEFSPDGRLIATSGEDDTAVIWNAATGSRLTPPLRHRDTVVRVVFSPDSRFVLTASSDATARVWDAATGSRHAAAAARRAGALWRLEPKWKRSHHQLRGWHRSRVGRFADERAAR